MGLIKENVEFLLGRIQEYKGRIQAQQALCPHTKVVGKYGANTGNWCAQDDAYWITADCIECGQHFYVESKRDPEGYRRLSLTGDIT